VKLTAEQRIEKRRTRPFGPTETMTLCGLVILVLLSLFLIREFDIEAAEREQVMVDHGFRQQRAEMSSLVSAQIVWDEAVQNLDLSFNREWADFNFGDYFYTYNDFTHGFIIDGEGKIAYAALDGKPVSPQSYAPFAPKVAKLVSEVRKLEAKRGPLRRRSSEEGNLTEPINASGTVRVSGKVYVINAGLVQPDLGKVLPRGPRAAMTVLARPIDQTMLSGFADRYLLSGLELVERPSVVQAGKVFAVLLDPDGKTAAVLAWTPRQPGTLLFERLKWPLLVTLVLLALVAASIVRRGSRVASELVASEARALHLAYHDTLTRLPNRALLFERLRPLLANLEHGTGEVAVLCADLDRFKEINDTLGHHAGDLLIEAVAVRLRKVCGEETLIARLGGDEFVVLCENGEPGYVEDLADAILEAVRQPLESEYGRLEVGCSVGYAIIDRPGVEPFEALRWADLALYRSKEMGRMQVTRFAPEMDAALRNRRSLESDLRSALSDGTLTMVYQPQVNRRGEVTAVEALVRWTHPERGVISPGVFVPLAEECGLILGLGEFVMRQVFAETCEWTRVRIAINVSAVQMRAPGFAALVTRLVASAGIDPSRYEIELTETALLGDDPVTAANVVALKRLGFTIALDDFGTGYSSLAVLQRFSVDKIKIDRSFVSCLGGSGESEALVDAMIRLARALKLTVIAEGVETEAQLEHLFTSGCREFQGHLIGMPATVSELAWELGEGTVEAEPRRAVS
jgi:diguanylate cyclase (GGDEF)-like protein